MYSRRLASYTRTESMGTTLAFMGIFISIVALLFFIIQEVSDNNNLRIYIGQVETRLEKKMDDGFTKIDTKFTEVDTRLDSVEVRLDSVDTRLDSVEVRLDSVDTRLDSVEVQLDSVQIQLHQINEGLDKLNKKFDSPRGIALISKIQESELAQVSND